MPTDMVQAVAAAEMALAAMSLRAILVREAGDAPNIASMSVQVALDVEGSPTVEVQFFNRGGVPAWGFSL